MHRLLVVTVAALAFAVLAPATAGAISLGEADGITLVRSKTHGAEFRFAPRAAKWYRRIAGRKVKVVCSTVEPNGGGFSVTGESSGSPIRVPKRGRRLPTLDASSDLAFCEIRRDGNLYAIVPATADGRTYLDEIRTFGLMLFVPFTLDEDAAKDGLTIEEAVREGLGIVVGLTGQDDTPPPGKTGYWTDGTTIAVVRLTSAGRRLFVELQPNYVVRTNVLVYFQED